MIVRPEAGRTIVSKTPKRPTRPQTAAPAAKGTLFVHTIPWTKVRVGGRDLGTTPFYNVSLPVGTHTLHMVDGKGKRYTRRVRIQAGKATKKFYNFEKNTKSR